MRMLVAVMAPVSFTFHNVSINSQKVQWIKKVQKSFTFHNVSINSIAAEMVIAPVKHLHSTMFLLIPQGRCYPCRY